jgi:predicted DNA-binding protein with PD1-like motif
MGTRWAVKLDRGEDVNIALTDFAAEHGITAGTVMGIGALEKVMLGYYALSSREYQKKLFEGDYELVGLTGNFALVEGKPFLHAHAVIADEEHRCFAGHLFSGRVSITVEAVVQPLEGEIRRELDPEVDLNLMAL